MISLIKPITPSALKFVTTCKTELIILIFKSTFSGETPNKLPAFPAVAPDTRSHAPNIISNVNAVLAPAPTLVKNVVILLLNLLSIPSEFRTTISNISSANPDILVANGGNFCANLLPIAFIANFAISNNLPISPLLPATFSTVSPTAFLTTLPEPFCAASLANFA